MKLSYKQIMSPPPSHTPPLKMKIAETVLVPEHMIHPVQCVAFFQGDKLFSSRGNSSPHFKLIWNQSKPLIQPSCQSVHNAFDTLQRYINK